MSVPPVEGAVSRNSYAGPLLVVEGSKLDARLASGRDHDPGVEYFMMKYRDLLFPFFDVGANVGLFTVHAAKLNEQGEVFAFEPHPTNAGLLRHNIDAYALRNVRVWEVATSSDDGFLSLGLAPSGMSVGSSVEKRQIAARSLRSVIQETGVAPRFMKLDIEGAEMIALHGCLGSPGFMDCILEMEFSWRDHRRSIGELHRIRPLDSYDYEFLLAADDLRAFERPLVSTEIEVGPSRRKVHSVVISNQHEWDALAEALQVRTVERGSRKWECCITPRQMTRQPMIRSSWLEASKDWTQLR